MEYIVILALLAIIALMFFKQPNKVATVIINTIVEKVRASESQIVQAVYNSIPEKIRKDVDSKHIADVVAYAINFIAEILEGIVAEKK